MFVDGPFYFAEHALFSWIVLQCPRGENEISMLRLPLEGATLKGAGLTSTARTVGTGQMQKGPLPPSCPMPISKHLNVAKQPLNWAPSETPKTLVWYPQINVTKTTPLFGPQTKPPKILVLYPQIL